TAFLVVRSSCRKGWSVRRTGRSQLRHGLRNDGRNTARFRQEGGGPRVATAHKHKPPGTPSTAREQMTNTMTSSPTFASFGGFSRPNHRQPHSSPAQPSVASMEATLNKPYALSQENT